MNPHMRPAIVALLLASATDVGTSRIAGVSAQQPPAGGAFELRPGVVVDPERRMAYVMNPKGGIDALGLARGQLVWHSDEAARPLGASGNLLVAQAEVRPSLNELHVRTLDLRTGRRRVAVTHTLPPGTRATVVGTAEGSFLVQANVTARDATLAWEFMEAPLQGVKPGALDVDAAPADRRMVAETSAARLPTTTGVVRIDLPNGRATEVAGAQQATFQAHRRADVPAEQRVGAITGEQFISADGRHVLTSERVADDSVWDKYEWTIFDRTSGRNVGTLRDYRAHAPFAVVGSSIIYETGPFERRTDAGMETAPLQIRSVDLVKGAQLWIRPVRDTTYRGPYPS